MMGNQGMVDQEDQETLFRPSNYKPYALYFVQSPSNTSHANSHTPTDLYHVPHHTESLPRHLPYSSSRGSNASYLHEKKISYYENDDNRLIEHDYEYNDDDDNDEFEEEDEEKEEGWVRFLSFSTYPCSTLWICLQILWRLILSLGVALIVFYTATKPPPPHVSVEIAKIGEFGLGEGADATGVISKLLTINCSMNLSIKNKSNFYSLHIQPPTITMSFGHLPIVISYGPNKFYARSDGSTIFELIVATRNKPMYGGGRDMQDMIDLNKGLPLIVELRVKSSFRVVWGFISPRFHHKAECLLLLGRVYDKKNHTQKYKSRCLVAS